MPSNFIGLVLFVVFLTPGYVYLVRKRKLSPAPIEDSQIVELVGLVSISVISNAVTVGLLLVARWLSPEHTPDLNSFAVDTADYYSARPGYVGAWALIMLTASCAVALGLAHRSWALPLIRLASPLIVDASTWYHVFEHPPTPADPKMQAYPYLTCRLHDGTTVWGRLAWYNTDVDETPDRDLALAAPIHIRDAQGEAVQVGSEDTLVLSARDMKVMQITWVDEPKPEARSPWWRGKRSEPADS